MRDYASSDSTLHPLQRSILTPDFYTVNMIWEDLVLAPHCGTTINLVVLHEEKVVERADYSLYIVIGNLVIYLVVLLWGIIRGSFTVGSMLMIALCAGN